MYSYKWEPKTIEIEQDGEKQTFEPLFNGTIEVRAPKYSERISYLKQAGLDMDQNELQMVNDANRAERMIEIAKKHIISVDIKRIEDDYKFTSVDDLECDVDAGVLLIQVASSVIEGVRLGKDLKKVSKGK